MKEKRHAKGVGANIRGLDKLGNLQRSMMEDTHPLTLKKREKPKKALVVGDIVLRPVSVFKKKEWVVLDFPMKEESGQMVAFRADLGSYMAKGFVASPAERGSGTVCFMKKDDFIKASLRDPNKCMIGVSVFKVAAGKNAAYVSPVMGNKAELFKHYTASAEEILTALSS